MANEKVPSAAPAPTTAPNAMANASATAPSVTASSVAMDEKDSSIHATRPKAQYVSVAHAATSAATDVKEKPVAATPAKALARLPYYRRVQAAMVKIDSKNPAQQEEGVRELFDEENIPGVMRNELILEKLYSRIDVLERILERLSGKNDNESVFLQAKICYVLVYANKARLKGLENKPEEHASCKHNIQEYDKQYRQLLSSCIKNQYPPALYYTACYYSERYTPEQISDFLTPGAESDYKPAITYFKILRANEWVSEDTERSQAFAQFRDDVTSRNLPNGIKVVYPFTDTLSRNYAALRMQPGNIRAKDFLSRIALLSESKHPLGAVANTAPAVLQQETQREAMIRQLQGSQTFSGLPLYLKVGLQSYLATRRTAIFQGLEESSNITDFPKELNKMVTEYALLDDTHDRVSTEELQRAQAEQMLQWPTEVTSHMYHSARATTLRNETALVDGHKVNLQGFKIMFANRSGDNANIAELFLQHNSAIFDRLRNAGANVETRPYSKYSCLIVSCVQSDTALVQEIIELYIRDLKVFFPDEYRLVNDFWQNICRRDGTEYTRNVLPAR